MSEAVLLYTARSLTDLHGMQVKSDLDPVWL